MKSIIHIILLGVLMMPGLNQAQAQEKTDKTKTIEVEVRGVCGMCKERIENGALIKGVKYVEYNKETEKLKVIYKSKKVTEDEIHKAVAAIGHDTDKVRASDAAYGKLPDCCSYRGDIEKH
ncbi:MAG: metal transporter [Flavobacteriales bacterium]|nr:metal transporter [Flavobacteriales bacterium]